ncbi:MAG: putative permease, partial [Pseudorhodobacter sp.]
MEALLEVILPVFLVLGFGYLAAWRGWISQAAVDGLMGFVTNFGLPLLLFRSIADLDLSKTLDIGLLVSFFAGALGAFWLAYLAARFVFSRNAVDAVAIGFAGMFSNSLMLGVPITERAYGADALAANYVITAFHAPLIYTFGIMMMEMSRGHDGGRSVREVAKLIVQGVLRNPLVIGIAAGFAVNLLHIPQPAPFQAATAMLAQSALPAALFGLGGILMRYKPEGDLKTIGMVCCVSLVAHPAITYGLGRHVFDLDTAKLRSAVITAAMAPGVNAFLFANMYGAAKRVSASTVLLATVA